MQVVMTGLDDEPLRRDDDCWQHLTVAVDDLPLAGAAVRRFLQADDAVSVALVPGAPQALHPADQWLAVEQLLDDCGRAGGVVFLAEPLVRHFDEDGAGSDVAELASALAEASGVVLLVLLAERRVVAAKPDGRVESVDCEAGPPVPGDAFCSAFLARYLDDPADLGAAMRGAAATRG